MIISRATPVPQVDGKKPYTTGWNTHNKKISLVKNSFFCYLGKVFFPSSSQKLEKKACEILLSLSLCAITRAKA